MQVLESLSAIKAAQQIVHQILLYVGTGSELRVQGGDLTIEKQVKLELTRDQLGKWDTWRQCFAT
jgi:hypothetical protein